MSGTQQRADAAANRERIVAAAREVASGTEEFRLNAVAKRAGVGQGTLYRHFPTRDDLLAEVYRQDVLALTAHADELLGQHPPAEALARWLDRVADYARVKRGVFAAVEAGARTRLADDSHGPIGQALAALLHAGQADGTIRADVDAPGVITLIGYLSRLDEEDWETRARPLLDVVLHGLLTRDAPVRSFGRQPGPPARPGTGRGTAPS
ncbi:TetR/AcrR family transcriptional regulator [Actinacidiphila rubida]|uniref:TetR/AcrR family transcriptional regulator n=1 Tax=Actinacidiphila rubida TaxID=310780 RepID=UPI000849E267|nr:TetR/AcrR family transcriptional regulator [Actinacidiphila rubida]